MSSWFFQPIFNSFALVVVAGIALGLLLLIGPSYRRISVPRRAALVAIRAVIILLVVLAMLRPTHVSSTRKPHKAVLLLLLDASRSMQLPQAASERTRWQAQLDALRRSKRALATLGNELEVRVYAYDVGLAELPFADGQIKLPSSPEGSQTDIGTNLHEALQRAMGQRLAGVVLLGDGVQTAYAPAVEIQQAGRELSRLGYPLYCVPFGPTGDAVQARDVAVESLADQYTVFVKNELLIAATLRIYGYANKPIPVELLIEHPGGHREVIETRVFQAREDGQQLAVDIRYTPQQPGRYKLIVKAAAQPGELVVKNNELSTFLRVLEGGLRVLYCEGELRNEQKFLRRSLAASPDIDVDFQWINLRLQGDRTYNFSKLLSDPEYDVFILGDLDSRAFSEEDLQRLAVAVDRGKGLLLLGGYHSFGAGGYGQTELAKVLPIVIDRLERQDFDAPIRNDLHIPGPLQMLPVRSHPAVSLAAGEANREAWHSLPPLLGANKFFGVKDTAGTLILAESERGDPLLISSEYGQGRILVFAGDSTWRWWMHGRENLHQRFWRQAVLWLAHRDGSEQDEVFVRLDQRRLDPGSHVSFRVGVQAAGGVPLTDVTVRCRMIRPDGTARDLSVARGDEQWQGTIPSVQQPGDYVIEATAERNGKMIGTARGEFVVLDRDVELSNPSADHDQLARLANLTEEVGGRMVPPERLPALFEEICQRPPEMEIEVQTKWQMADTSRDAWFFFLLFVAMLVAEWFLRKRWGLV